MNTPTESLAVISTAHVSETEAEALTDGGAILLGGLVREEGWMLHTRRIAPGYTGLNYVLGTLNARGYDWVLFDRDAEYVEGLEVFDW